MELINVLRATESCMTHASHRSEDWPVLVKKSLALYNA